MSAPDLLAAPRALSRFWPAQAGVRLRAQVWLGREMMLPALLDLLRGGAALVVLVFHLRSWLMVPYAEAAPHGPALALFYGLTAFGHEAVLVFFVLSGFLIGGAVLRLDFAAPGAVTRYAMARVARIAPVLVGAVLLAILLRAVVAPPLATASCHDTGLAIAGNLLALGNLGVPVLCNDLPLWSLSNEVAYYIAFPVLVALGRGYRASGVLAPSAVVLAMAWAALTLTPWDDRNVVLYFPAWLAGAALWWLPTHRRWPRWPGLIILAAALAASRMPGAETLFVGRDALTTLGVAALLAGCLGRRWPGTMKAGLIEGLAAAGAGLATISFSLYVVHAPIIDAALRVMARHGTSVPLTRVSWPAMMGLTGATIAAAVAFSLVFERPHRALARRLEGMLAPTPRSAKSAAEASKPGAF